MPSTDAEAGRVLTSGAAPRRQRGDSRRSVAPMSIPPPPGDPTPAPAPPKPQPTPPPDPGPPGGELVLPPTQADGDGTDLFLGQQPEPTDDTPTIISRSAPARAAR